MLSDVLNDEAEKYKENVNALLDSSNLVKEELRCQLDFVKLSAVIEESDVQELVEKVLMMQGASMHRHHVKIERNFEKVPLVKIQKNKFVNVLTNMLKNAREAMAETAEEVRNININIKNNGDGYVHISVTDRGIGLNVQNQQSIFSLGYTTKNNGHGIGLHISANYMADMGGYIKITSPGINLGATVTLGLLV